MRIRPSFVLAGAVVLAANLGCSKSGGEHVLASAYTLDVTESLARSDENERAWLKKQLTGVEATLECFRDNTFHLVVKGGSAPTDATGTFKSGFDYVELTATTVDGKPVAAPEPIRPKALRGWVILKIGSANAWLRQG